MSRHTLGSWRGGILIAVACLFLWVPSLMSQTSGTGALTGTITDATGAVVPNAKITATSVATGQQRTVTSGGNGSYDIPLLPPGDYRLKFEAAGFQTVEVPVVTITVTETGTLNRVLTVGSQTQEVTVQADVETLQTTNASLGTVMNSETVVDLPLTTRNYQNLIGFSAGASSSVPNATALGKATSTTAVNGSDATQNNFQLDGVSVGVWESFANGTESFFSTQGIPSPDAIAEFKIQTSSYDAGYGRNTGANINVVTKSGTNDFHGTAFEFFRNTVLNANDFFFNLTGKPRGALDQNQYGGVFGGPVKKDKLFFFVSYQETAQKNGITGGGSSTVHLPPIPTGNRGTCPANWTVLTQCDAAGQAFVPALGAAICPGNNPNAGAFDKVTITGSIQVFCDGSDINPVAVNILQLKLPNGNYYLPGSGISPNAPYPLQVYSIPARYEEHQGMGNWDYVISPKNTLSGRYFYAADPSFVPFVSSLPGSPETTDHWNDEALLRLTTIISNNLVNEARISYQYNKSDLNNPTVFTDTQVGITPLATGLPALSYIGIGGVYTIGTYGFALYEETDNQFQWADQISWTHGKHTIRAGFEAERIQVGIHFPGQAIGQPALGSFPDFLIGRAAGPVASGGNGTTAASNITGVGTTTSAIALGGLWPNYYRVPDFDAYVQDDLKVNSRLTVNLGLRWEYDGLSTEVNGAYSAIWPTLIQAAGIPGNSPATGSLEGFVVPSNFHGPIPPGVNQLFHRIETGNSPPMDNFAPRLGVAWQPTKNGRWVVRAGAGYFYDRASGYATVDALYHAEPYHVSPTPAPTLTLANPFLLPTTIPGPPGIGAPGWTPRWINFGATPNVNSTANSNIANPTTPENWVTPLQYEWNLSTQYEFIKDWVLQLGYVGSHGIHEPTSGSYAYFYNVAPLASVANPIHCGYDGNPADCITASTAANVPNRVPNLGLSVQDSSGGPVNLYKFNSLQATVRHQFSHGLQLNAAYTWAKAMSTVPVGISSLSMGSTVCCLGPQREVYGLNTAYRPQRLVVTYTWQLPGHAQGIAGKLVDGWAVSGVTTIQKGDPLTPTDSRAGAVYGFANAPRPTLLAQYCAGAVPGNIPTTGSPESRVLGTYLNKTGVFCTPPSVGADGSTGWGDGGLGTVFGPGQDSWDISLAKLTTVGGIRENATLEFRTEFFNAFNHPQFSDPTVNVASATFGKITSSSVNPRLIQFALKYSF